MVSYGCFLSFFLSNENPLLLSRPLEGIIIMPAALIGNISSGFIIKKLNLNARGCGRLLVFLTIISTVIMPIVYFLSCPDTKYAGLSDGVVRYIGRGRRQLETKLNNKIT